jgi:hypothetical protein
MLSAAVEKYMFDRRWLFWMVVIGVVAGAWVAWKKWPLWTKEQSAATPTRITVYQSVGSSGEASFSDRPQHGSARVVDTRQGTTYQSTYHGQVPNTASATYDAPNPHHPVFDPVQHLRHENFKTQEKMIEGRERQVMQATGQE